jgi:stress responsive alpha/beta barrel protein
MITHIVFFKLKDKSPASLQAAKEKLLSMNGKIDLLRHLEAGTDVIRSERSYDVALVTRFDSLADLQAYQVHPYHANEVGAYMKAASESVVAVDYES